MYTSIHPSIHTSYVGATVEPNVPRLNRLALQLQGHAAVRHRRRRQPRLQPPGLTPMRHRPLLCAAGRRRRRVRPAAPALLAGVVFRECMQAQTQHACWFCGKGEARHAHVSLRHMCLRKRMRGTLLAHPYMYIYVFTYIYIYIHVYIYIHTYI